MIETGATSLAMQAMSTMKTVDLYSADEVRALISVLNLLLEAVDE